MSNSSSVPPANDDIDLGSLGAALWRAKGWIAGLTLAVGAATFIALSMMRPLYTSEVRVLVLNEETAFTRPTTEQGNTNYRTTLDEQAVQSQVQVLTSRDLILKVVRELDLTQNAAFARDAGKTLVERLLQALSLGRSSQESQEERAANALAEHLDVYQLSNSSVIAVEYTSGDSQLAAKIANQLADDYIGWQRDEKIAQTKDATAWLDAQIKALRTATAESEEAVESFKASEGLYSGSNDVTLNAQQLSELNSQLILAEAQESEARARAKLIKKMLATSGDIDATPEVLNSQLVINLIEQRVLVQRQLAELSATLLPSHPRIQQLRSELADVRAQIRTEAQKVVQSLENQAQVAAAREESLRASLDAAKNRSAGQSDAEVKLRALEREAKANRDLLESYLARYRDASARHDIGAVPAQAAIVSRAHASVLPSFPRRGPITLLVMAATALLSIGSVLAKAIIMSGGADRRQAPAGYYRPDELVPSEPEYMSSAEMIALSRMRERKQRPAAPRPADDETKPVVESRRRPELRGKPKAKRRPTDAPQGKAMPPSRPSAEAVLETRTGSSTEATQEASVQDTSAKDTPRRERPVTTKPAKALLAGPATVRSAPIKPPASAQEPTEDSNAKGETTPTSREGARKSIWRPAKPAKRPTWLAVNEPRSAELDRTPDADSEPPEAEEPKLTGERESPREATTADEPKVEVGEAHDDTRDVRTRDEIPGEDGSSDEDSSDGATKKPAGGMATLASLAATGAAQAARTETTQPSKTREDSPRAALAPSAETDEPSRDRVRDEEPKPSSAEPPSAMDFVHRVRQDMMKQDAPALAPGSATRRSGGFFDRLRGRQTEQASKAAPRKSARMAKARATAPQQDEPNESEMAALSPNDLRHYLTQRISASDVKDEWETPKDPQADLGEVGPVLGTLDDVIDTVLESSTGGLPRTMLVAGTDARAQSPQAAIAIARSLADRNEQVALVDLAKGAAVVSGQLNLPRVPGFADLAAGSVDFADVVKLDEGSTLQVIPAGNPTANEGYYEPDKFMRVFEALTQTYDCVVLHADMAAIESLMPALKFELPVAVAVLPPRATPEDERDSLATVQRLGCPIVIYGKGGKQKQRRFSLFGRKVAV